MRASRRLASPTGILTRVKQQHQEPIQLDLFVPHDHGYEFKVILINKPLGASAVVPFARRRSLVQSPSEASKRLSKVGFGAIRSASITQPPPIAL
jgi:hypothetical protein